MSHRKVKYARFHAEVFVPDVGTLQQVLPSKSKNYPGLRMELHTDGLHVWMQARKKVGVFETPYETEVLVPAATLALVQFDEADKSPAASKEEGQAA